MSIFQGNKARRHLSSSSILSSPFISSSSSSSNIQSSLSLLPSSSSSLNHSAITTIQQLNDNKQQPHQQQQQQQPVKEIKLTLRDSNESDEFNQTIYQKIQNDYNSLETLQIIAHSKFYFFSNMVSNSQFGKWNHHSKLNNYLKNLSLINCNISRKQFKIICDDDSLRNHLISLNLSHNTLDQIPEKINKMKSLKVLNLSHNQFTQFSEHLRKMKQLTHLDFSFNQIENLFGISFKKGGGGSSKKKSSDSSRNLTIEFHNEKISSKQHKPLANSLLSLNLSNNRLYGGYPQCLDDLRLLETLDLSGNPNLFSNELTDLSLNTTTSASAIISGNQFNNGNDSISKSAPNLTSHHLMNMGHSRSTLNLSQVFTVVNCESNASTLEGSSFVSSSESNVSTSNCPPSINNTPTNKVSPRMSRVIRKTDNEMINIEKEILLQRKQTVSSLLISEHYHHSITEIDIGSCGLVNFPIEWLRRFPKLKILKMNNNGPFGLETQQDDLPSTIRGLSFLRKLEMKNCFIKGSIQSLMSLSSIDFLDLSYNRLMELPQIPTDYITSNIETLKLSHNNLRFINNNSMLEKLYSTITYLDLSHNYLEHIQDNTLTGMVQLKYLDLSYNCLKKLPSKLFSGMRYLKNLTLCYNELVFEKMFLDANTIQDLSLMKRIEHIDLSFNRIKCLKGIEMFSETLYVLDLSYNDIHWNNQVFDSLFQLKNIEKLNLSGCGLTTHDFENVAGNRWLDFRYLHELKLNRNCLTSLNIHSDQHSATKKLNELRTIECSFNFISLKDQQQISQDWKKISPKLTTINTYSLYNHLYTSICEKVDWENPSFTTSLFESVLFCDSNLLHLHKCITKEMKNKQVTHIIQIISESDERFKLCDGIDPHRFSEYIFKTYKIHNTSIEYLVVYLPSSNRLNFEKLDECVKWIEDSKEHCLISEYNPSQSDKDLTMLVQQKVNLFLAPSSPPSLSEKISDDSIKAVSTHSNHSSSTSSLDFDEIKIFEASYSIIIAYLIKNRQLRLECAIALLRDLMILNGSSDVTLIPYQHHLLLQYDLKLREIRYLSQSSLKRTLERDDLRTQFKHYCSTEQSSQNILFWEMVEFTYKTEYRVKERMKIAKEIFNTFISESSTSPLNITQNQIHTMAKLIFSDELEQITHDYLPLNLFDNMVTVIENVMVDTERRFQRVKL